MRNLRRLLHTTMRLDPAVTKLLSLDPSTTTVSSHGGVGMSSASTAKITTKLADGSEKDLFMKTGRGKDAEIMFQGTPEAYLFDRRSSGLISG